MKHAKKIVAATLCAAVIALVPAFAGCSQSQAYVTSIAKSGSEGNDDIYTIYYSDGTTSTFTVTNGSDGVTADDLYQKYIEETGDNISYSEFLSKYLTVEGDNSASAINYCLQSSLKIYSEFVAAQYNDFNMFTGYNTSVYTGAAVIYDIDNITDGYTYIVTNYHVVYLNSAQPALNGGTKVARSIYGYLYGSEGTPSASGQDSNGYTAYDYGDYGIELEYVGGSVENDIAVLRVETDKIKAVNENIRAVDIADDYYVGETAIAIGNPEGNGLSVTKGIISTENELISLNIDGTSRTYRSLRIDTPLYSGNSGGGLFNSSGELIGITNAGNTEDQNINYAIPLEIVTGTVDNIICYANDGDNRTNGAYTVKFGITVSSSGSKYVYDSDKGYGEITENVNVESVTTDTIAAGLGLQNGDVIKKIEVNGTEKEINRTFTLGAVALTLRSGDKIRFVLERDGETVTTSIYTISSSDLVQVE